MTTTALKDSAFFAALFATVHGAATGALLRGAKTAYHYALGQSQQTLVIPKSDALYDAAQDWLASLPSMNSVTRFYATLGEGDGTGGASEYGAGQAWAKANFSSEPSVPDPFPLTKSDGIVYADVVSLDGIGVVSPPPSMGGKLENVDGIHLRVGAPQYHFRFAGAWLTVKQVTKPGNARDTLMEELEITTWSRRRDVLVQLLSAIAAHRADRKKQAASVFVSNNGNWSSLLTRKMRPVASVILPSGLVSDVVSDARAFLADKGWYAKMGVPYRRGYLLHGLPGTGKSSLVQAVAGELGLDVYILRLSDPTMSDWTLDRLLQQVPSPAVVMVEDVEVAFAPSVNEERDATLSEFDEKSIAHFKKKSELTDSGLRNALDGPTASEGRLLFLTTNRRDKLDPILIRPGRVDREIKFTYATSEQLIGLWERFFPTSPLPASLPLPCVTMAQWQSYLLLHRNDAQAAVLHLPDWKPEIVAGVVTPSLPFLCPNCHQIPDGQSGEFPCPQCGLPTVHDELAKETT